MRTCPQCATTCEEVHRFCPQCGFPLAKVAANSDDPLVGTTLPGGYVILDLVGIGGMGRVYRAEQTNLGRTVAVKIIHPHLVGEENAAARFITEARAASKLNHPNSVGVIDFGKTDDGQLYLVMEFLRGKDLARVQHEQGPLPFRRTIGILRQVLAALSEAHHMGIIHRDLKPENIIIEPMRTGGDFVKVVDFGLAKMREPISKAGITSPGIVCGTPEYMSPEQGRGDELDARSDIYAVGVIFYQMVTGKLPFEADSPTQVVLMHLTEPPLDPREMAPRRMIPEPLVDVCLMALAKDRTHRFGDADEFSEALADALNQSEAPVSRVPTAQVRCNNCGELNPSAQKFCGECGGALVPMRPSFAPPPLSLGSKPPSTRATPIQLPLPLLDRDEDLAWLDEQRSATQTCRAVALVGESGAGKTRLIDEFIAIAKNSGDVVVTTGPDPGWAEVGYFALRRAIESLAAVENGEPASLGAQESLEVRSGLDLVRGSLGTSQLDLQTTPEERRVQAAAALRWAIGRAAERGKGRLVVLAVDDLHHIDGASRNAFAEVLRDPPDLNLLVVTAYPPGFEPGWPANNTTTRSVSGLTPATVTRYFTQSPTELLGERAVLPLYLEQLVRFSREHGGTAPTRLADLIALRVEHLAPDARRVLQAIAVYGDNSNKHVLARLLPENTDFAVAVQTLLHNGMIDAAQSGESDAYRISHPLVREVVLATIPAGVRRTLHQTAAEAADELHAPLEVRALHEFYAQNAFQALILLESLSARSAQRGDYNGQITALRRGLELARRELFRGELDDPLYAVLVFSRKLGEALAFAGDLTDAEGVLREALDLASPSGNDRARVLGVLAHVAHGRERREEAKNYLREALDLAKRSGSHELLTSLADIQRAIA